jgi:Holliday junction resolvase
MAARTPEGKIKDRLTAMLRRNGIWYFFPANNGMGKSGIPDVIAIVSGQFVGIECKADETRKPTKLQLDRAREIVHAGGRWFLVNSEESVAHLEIWIQWRLTRARSREGQGPGTQAEQPAAGAAGDPHSPALRGAGHPIGGDPSSAG